MDDKTVESRRRKLFFTASTLLIVGATLVFALSWLLPLKFGFSPVRERLEDPLPETATARVVLPGDEVRGVYIASVYNINFPSAPGQSEAALREEIDRILAVCSETGLDTIYLQVRPSGDALYDSAYFPTSRYLVDQEGDKAPLDVLSYFTEQAGELGLKVVAWVNPYRVTAFQSATKKEALSRLSEKNPARQHPDWTIFYSGKLYFDPSNPEVRELVCAGVREICENYTVAGILFDDYFYPYPVEGAAFDDLKSYEKWAVPGQSLEEFRRSNVNVLVRETYQAVKSARKDISFGVSPFGIWKNASSDPAGSPTKGMESYSELYCDTVTWIKNGWLDYISPQLYWEIGSEKTDFAALTRWWSAQVDGTDVKLIISHAAYRVEEFEGADEIIRQIRYARQFMNAAGNIQYGYAFIEKDACGLRTALREEYAVPYEEAPYTLETQGVVFKRPADGKTTVASSQFVLCASDPRFPVYDAFGKIARTKSGFFSVLMPLSVGENTLEVTQNDQVFSLRIYKKEAGDDRLNRTELSLPRPDPDFPCQVWEGNTLSLSVTGPAGASVTARLGGKETELNATLHADSAGLMREMYEGTMDFSGLPTGDLGKIEFVWKRDGQTLFLTGAAVSLMPASLEMIVTVTKDDSSLKKSPYSTFYEDYLNVSAGMKDRIIAQHDGYFQLAFGGYVARDAVSVKAEKRPDSTLSRVLITAGDRIDVTLTTGAAPPLDVRINDENVVISLFQTKLAADCMLPGENALFSGAKLQQIGQDSVLTLSLHSETNYYGFDYAYEEGAIVFSFAVPQRLAAGEKPLAGKIIVVDAGHGGRDCGASGFYNWDEKDLNLNVSLALKDRLEELGATVVMTRTDDTAVSLAERMTLLNQTHPDLSVSVHHNSVAEESDANSGFGTLGLYWSPAGISLARCVQKRTAAALGNGDAGVKKQELALCRNFKFPQTLIELGFICSPAEYERMIHPDYAALCAEGIAEGILDWYAMQADFAR